MLMDRSGRRRAVAALLAAVGFSGCAGMGLRPPPRVDTLAGIELRPPAYGQLTVGFVRSENTKNSLRYGRQGQAWADFDLDGMVVRLQAVFRNNFKAAVNLERVEDADAFKVDVIAVVDVFVDVGRTVTIKSNAILLSPERRQIDTVSAATARTFGPFNIGAQIEQASAANSQQLDEALRASGPMADYARAKAGAAAAPAAARAEPVGRAQAYRSDIDVPTYRHALKPDHYALVVGIGRYKDLPPADFAARDAETVREHLLALGYPQKNVIVLKDADATRTGMQKYLEEWLPRNVPKNGTVFFYYSGHGAPDTKTGQTYLVPWDGDAQFLQSTAYPLKQLYAGLERLPAGRAIVAVDACFSGAGGRSVLAKGARPLVRKVDLARPAADKFIVFTAAAGDEITASLEDQGHGMFTYYFVKGLAGAAKDASGDVTAGSLYGYLKPLVEEGARRQNRGQSPGLDAQEPGAVLAAFR